MFVHRKTTQTDGKINNKTYIMLLSASSRHTKISIKFTLLSHIILCTRNIHFNVHYFTCNHYCQAHSGREARSLLPNVNIQYKQMGLNVPSDGKLHSTHWLSDRFVVAGRCLGHWTRSAHQDSARNGVWNVENVSSPAPVAQQTG